MTKSTYLKAAILFAHIVVAAASPASAQVQATTQATGNPMTSIASGTNRSFHHIVQTTATRTRVWSLWTDTNSWQAWDRGLKGATLEGAFGLGAKGTILPLSGPPAAFEVTAFDLNQSYTFETKLPAARLVVKRSFVAQPGSDVTIFRHDVSFTGPLGWFWADRFGPGFRRALPPTMQGLANLAQADPS
jgi:Polyketide cyclase / dehydrase and lipid transport